MIPILNFIYALEILVFSDKVKKINMNEWTQERTLCITEGKIFNINKNKIKREILIKNLSGISRNAINVKKKSEFTLHVNTEYDYRFISEK